MTPEKILAAYERGQVTTSEAASKLVLAAAEHDPASFTGSMPAELLAELKEQSREIPRPEELFILRSVCRSGPFDPEQWKAEEQAEKGRYVAGLRTWKAYFESIRVAPTVASEEQQWP